MPTQQQIDEYLKTHPNQTMADVWNYASKQGLSGAMPTSTGKPNAISSASEVYNSDFQNKPLAERQAILSGSAAQINTPTNPQISTGNTVYNPPDGSAASIGYGDEAGWKAVQDAASGLGAEFSYEDTYNQLLQQRQSQIDATKAYYQDVMNQARVLGEGRIGSNRAVQARSGLLGSSFGAAQKGNIETANLEEQKGITNQMNVAVQGIYGQLSNDAMNLAKQKTEAKRQGAEALLNYYTVTVPQYKQNAAINIANQLLVGGTTPDALDDNELSKRGITKEEVRYQYNILKKQQDADLAAQKTAADKTALENAKTLAEIDKINADIAKGEIDSSKYYEVGNKIYEQGTNRYIGDAAFNPYTGAMQVTPGNQIYNPVTGQFTQAPVQGGGQIVYQGDPNTRAGRHNNPTAFTTDVAKTAGLVEGIDYTKGDAFTGGDGRTYYTANLLGNAVDQTIKAIDNYVARGAFPGWTYASKIGLTPQAWANADYNTKVGFLQRMQVEEGGKGQFVQQAGQGGVAQYDPIKGPQYEQYNSKGVVPKGVDPNTFKQEALAYKKESIGRESVKYLDSIDQLLASNITRNERLAINTAPGIASIKGSYADVINAYNNIISKLNLKSLTDAKAQGATFGQLSNQELKVLGDAATSLKLTSSDTEWKKQLAIIGNALLTASGQEPRYDTSGSQTVQTKGTTLPTTNSGTTTLSTGLTVTIE